MTATNEFKTQISPVSAFNFHVEMTFKITASAIDPDTQIVLEMTQLSVIEQHDATIIVIAIMERMPNCLYA